MALTSFSEQLIVVIDSITEVVSELLDSKLIKDSETFAEDKALLQILWVHIEFILDVSLLWEELGCNLCSYNELIHHSAHIFVVEAVSGASVRRQRRTSINYKIPVESFASIFTWVLKAYLVLSHVSTEHVMDLVVKLDRHMIWKDIETGHRMVVCHGSIWADLDPDTLDVPIHLCFNLWVKWVEAICDKQLFFAKLVDWERSITLLRHFGGLVRDEGPIVVDREKQVHCHPVGEYEKD